MQILFLVMLYILVVKWDIFVHTEHLMGNICKHISHLERIGKIPSHNCNVVPF